MPEFERFNPITGEVASRAEAMTVDAVRAIATRAGDAFPAWAALGPNARRAVSHRAADALMAKESA
ncbi:hypothetical protein OY671_009286, partial [Metschnikowia pulcherrima]